MTSKMLSLLEAPPMPVMPAEGVDTSLALTSQKLRTEPLLLEDVGGPELDHIDIPSSLIIGSARSAAGAAITGSEAVVMVVPTEEER